MPVSVLILTSPINPTVAHDQLPSCYVMIWKAPLGFTVCLNHRAMFNNISQLLTYRAQGAQLFVPGFIFVVLRCSL